MSMTSAHSRGSPHRRSKEKEHSPRLSPSALPPPLPLSLPLSASSSTSSCVSRWKKNIFGLNVIKISLIVIALSQVYICIHLTKSASPKEDLSSAMQSSMKDFQNMVLPTTTSSLDTEPKTNAISTTGVTTSSSLTADSRGETVKTELHDDDSIRKSTAAHLAQKEGIVTQPETHHTKPVEVSTIPIQNKRDSTEEAETPRSPDTEPKILFNNKSSIQLDHPLEKSVASSAGSEVLTQDAATLGSHTSSNNTQAPLQSSPVSNIEESTKELAPLQSELGRAEKSDVPSNTSTTALVTATASASVASSTTNTTAMETQPLSTYTTNAPFAYVFLIGGFDEKRHSYKGFLYNIIIAAHVLREKGSRADFVLWAQLSPNSNLTQLPEEVLRLLKLADIQVRMLPSAHPGQESFAQLVFEKFRLFQMIEYKRVMFLDADIMPRSNLDYLFEWSVPAVIPSSSSNTTSNTTVLPPIFRPNIILASRGEPCNTALFVVEPNLTHYQLVQDTITRQHEEGRKIPYPHFDRVRGWGHIFTGDDRWDAINLYGYRWQFHASHSDQGLMYYIAKYGIQDTSIVIGRRLQNWIPGDKGQPQLVSESHNWEAEHNHTRVMGPRPSHIYYSCDDNTFKCEYLPYRDFVHFSGRDKPWQRGYRQAQLVRYDAVGIWFEELKKINDEYKMGLNVTRWDTEHAHLRGESTMGYIANYADHAKLVHNKTNTGKSTKTTAPAVESTQTPKQLNGTRNNVIAYAVSFIKCGDFQTHSAGLTDASLILRHSVHKISSRNPASGSRYDYKMYAIVHRQAEICSALLQNVGFEVLVVDSPIMPREIQGDFLRNNVHREWCCGADEFIKLYAYNKIPEEIIVHVDIDFAFYKPMDNLFNAILYDKDSPEGKRARSQIERERESDVWPDRIDAFLTRDWPQVAPKKFPPGFQAGFLVARRKPEAFEEIVNVIREGNYSEGWGWKTGWGNKGYGGYVGAMAMQGLIAYYYDHIQPNTTVELNQCRYNHMGMDVRYNRPPNFQTRYGRKGQCRNNNPDDVCEDCMGTELDKIYSVHYTMCRKPWQCQATGLPGGKTPGGPRATAVNTDTVNLDHCMKLVKEWHVLRADFESQLFNLTGDETIRSGAAGTYRNDTFLGHCKDDGNDGYILLSGTDETYKRVAELYS